MQTWKATAATIAILAIGSTGAWAQATYDYNSSAQLPKTSPKTPTDPAAMPSGQGASTGESGVTAPAGNPSDPTTDQNQQPGMSPQNPSDPASADKPPARVPTSPPGTGSSAP